MTKPSGAGEAQWNHLNVNSRNTVEETNRAIMAKWSRTISSEEERLRGDFHPDKGDSENVIFAVCSHTRFPGSSRSKVLLLRSAHTTACTCCTEPVSTRRSAPWCAEIARLYWISPQGVTCEKSMLLQHLRMCLTLYKRCFLNKKIG